MNKIVSVAIVLLFVLMSLTACGSDPLGIVAREQVRTQAQVQTAQIQADAATDQARISASTARVRIGGWLVATTIIGVVAVAVVGIAGMVHIQAQRDRLTAEQWRTALPAQQPAPPSHRIPTAHTPAGHWLALRRPDSQRPTVLALPERSASAHDVIIIDG